jgi:ankyrin repeat protein
MLPEDSKGNALKQEFFAAAAAGDAVLMKQLIEAGMDVNAMDMAGKNGRTALMIAAEKGRVEAVKMLIEKGAGVDYRYEAGGYADYYYNDTALMFAARAGHAEVVRILIQAGADVNAQGAWNETALMSAAQGGSTEVVKILLDCGADPDAAAYHGETALDYAVARNYPEVIKLLSGGLGSRART